ncbi:MAG: imidazolonepropionase [Oceanospirillaceae bacterium]|nr:imidazolonepropionase [Oceanospirillaceae bacterium]
MDQTIDGGYGALRNQAIGICDDRIIAIAPMQDFVAPLGEVTIIDAKDRWLTPGFIDAHTHLVYAGHRADEFEQRLQGVSYTQIAKLGGGILSTVKATRRATLEELVTQSQPRLSALMAEGVTCVEIKSGYGLNIDDELKMLRAAKILDANNPVRVTTTLLAAHSVPPEYKNNPDQYIDLVCEQLIPLAVDESLVDAVDVFCEQIAFSPAQCERVFEAAQKHGLAIKGHMEQLSNQQGSQLAARYHALSVDHLEWLDEAGVQAISSSNTVATLLPSAFYFLRETKLPPIELLRRYQVPIAVATDLNPGSAPLASIRLAMHMACTLFRLTPHESLAGVTCHAAKALGLSASIGQLKVGMKADMLLWNIESPAQLSYQFGMHELLQKVFDGRISDVG